MSNTDNLFSPRFFHKDVTIHKKERMFKSYFAMDSYDVSYRRFEGKESPIVTRELFERDSYAVAVLAWDEKTDEIALIEQFRPGALSDPVTPWLIEIVAGIIDKGESTVQTAIREAKEEIGVNISENDLFCFKTVYPSPGCITEKVTLYVAKTDLSHLGNHGGLESECEDIRVFKAKLSDAYEQVLHGRINNSIAMIGILYLMHNKEEVLKHFAK